MKQQITKRTFAAILSLTLFFVGSTALFYAAGESEPIDPPGVSEDEESDQETPPEEPDDDEEEEPGHETDEGTDEEDDEESDGEEDGEEPDGEEDGGESGESDKPEENGEKSEEPDEPEEELTQQVYAAGAQVEVATLQGVRDAIAAGADYIILTDHVSFSDYKQVDIPTGRDIVIEGAHPDVTVTQNDGYRFVVASNARLTLKGLNLVSGHSAAIIYASDGGTGIFEEVTFTGVQPFHGGGVNEMIVRGGTFTIQKNGNGGEEFFQGNRLTFEGGSGPTRINHALTDNNTHAVFFFENGTSGQSYIHLTNEAEVIVNSGDYVLFTSLGAIEFIVDDDCVFDITAGGFNYATGHAVRSLSVGARAYFSYTQPYNSNLSGPTKGMYVNGDVSVAKDATLRISTKAYGMHAGSITATEPKLVSIYGATAALYGAPTSVSVEKVNAVNYWSTAVADTAAPDGDSAVNWPQYMWNTYTQDAQGTSYIGEQFGFSAGSNGVVNVGGDIPEALGRSTQTLADALRFTVQARRVVFGNIDPFEIDRVRSYEGQINGRLTCSDAMAQYDGGEHGILQTHSGSLPLAFHELAAPRAGEAVSVVANLNGLRAAMRVDSSGSLELIAIPNTIHFGANKEPATTTVYERKVTSSTDEDGNMLVQVLDTRGDDGGRWELVVHATGEAPAGKQLLPASSLIFRTLSGTEHSLDQGPVVVHTGDPGGTDHEVYSLIWSSAQGLLARVFPGELGPGDYGAVLNWSVQSAPEE